METVKGTDLPDLLEHLGYSVRRLGSRYHTTREMDSIRIKDRRTWKRYSNGKGGDAITFLQEFCGKDFREAVNYLLEFTGKRSRDSPAPRSKPAQQEEKPVFTLPIAKTPCISPMGPISTYTCRGAGHMPGGRCRGPSLCTALTAEAGYTPGCTRQSQLLYRPQSETAGQY